MSIRFYFKKVMLLCIPLLSIAPYAEAVSVTTAQLPSQLAPRGEAFKSLPAALNSASMPGWIRDDDLNDHVLILNLRGYPEDGNLKKIFGISFWIPAHAPERTRYLTGDFHPFPLSSSSRPDLMASTDLLINNFEVTEIEQKKNLVHGFKWSYKGGETALDTISETLSASFDLIKHQYNYYSIFDNQKTTPVLAIKDNPYHTLLLTDRSYSLLSAMMRINHPPSSTKHFVIDSMDDSVDHQYTSVDPDLSLIKGDPVFRVAARSYSKNNEFFFNFGSYSSDLNDVTDQLSYRCNSTGDCDQNYPGVYVLTCLQKNKTDALELHFDSKNLTVFQNGNTFKQVSNPRFQIVPDSNPTWLSGDSCTLSYAEGSSCLFVMDEQDFSSINCVDDSILLDFVKNQTGRQLATDCKLGPPLHLDNSVLIPCIASTSGRKSYDLHLIELSSDEEQAFIKIALAFSTIPASKASGKTKR